MLRIEPRLPNALRPLRHSRYRAFWLSNLCTNFGIWIQTVAAAWLMISLTPRSDMVAMIQTAMTLPAVVSAVLGGILSDLWTRRIVLLSGQVVVLGGTLLLAVLQGFQGMTPWLLLGFTFMVGAGTNMNLPALQASAGDLVPYEDIPRAIALNAIGYNIARSLGPAIGGSLVAAFGVATAFGVSAALHLMLLIVLFRSRAAAKRRDLPPEPFTQAFAAGFHYLWRAPSAMAAMVHCAAFAICASAVWALLPLLAEQHEPGNPVLYGMLLACLSAGAVTGAFLFDTARNRLGSKTLVNAGCLILALSLLLLAVTPLWVPMIAALFAVGLVWVGNLTTYNITVQLSVAEWVKTRILALYYVCLSLGMAGGSWLWGITTQTFGLQTALLAAAAAAAATFVLAFLLPLPTQLANDLAPLDSTFPFDLPANVDPGRDPVVVDVSYEIPPDAAGAFRETMERMRMIRLRDGASHWELLQSVSHPAQWTERFTVRSWMEYLRRRSRLTQRDWKVIEQARAFHLPAEKPKVSRFFQRRG